MHTLWGERQRKRALGSCLDFQWIKDALLLYPTLCPPIKLSRCGSRLNPIVSCASDCHLEVVSITVEEQVSLKYSIYLRTYFQWKIIKLNCHKNTSYIYIVLLSFLPRPHCSCLHTSGWRCQFSPLWSAKAGFLRVPYETWQALRHSLGTKANRWALLSSLAHSL